MHKRLQRQLKRLKKKNVSDEAFQAQLLEMVNETYIDSDRELARNEHSLSQMAVELTHANQKILDQSQAFMDAIMDNMVEGFVVTDMNHKILS
ncbi:MAG: hypothetical protein AAF206_28195, partial [Bacteroidota bacterium]